MGTNLGDRELNIANAILAIKSLPKTKVIEVSKKYITKPFMVPDKQEDYLNCCVKIETKLQAQTLLGACLGIEAAMGRQRTFKNSSRVIDIDLLLYEGEKSDTDDLVLPHPRIRERAFVMVPLSDICVDKNILGFDFHKEYKAIDKSGVEFYR
ncbi:MAG: 2-amino-4-hydroxy-6-hydroxymethyldihydropteridine diphosphokinase [Eubacteriales bacterium SKADARSKE-1]|nr:2-amino-4-hydroxy-6-hydroxymethyldihydropteridine diphosphokinase [Eubacteriales bacterium SKADARSKE-1]